jgi:RNA polymerase sigma factor (sigma-70 family)
MKRCKARISGAKKCSNNAIDETGFCRAHHPIAEKRRSTGGAFEASVTKVLRLLGYTVQRNVTVAGCQIDMLAEYRTGVIRIRLLVECKDYEDGRTVGVDEVKEFSGVLYPARGKAVDKGLIVARSGFTRSARELADSAGLDLVEFSELANQLLDLDGYIDRVIAEFDDSLVAKCYIDLSYATTEDYLGGDPELIQRPLDRAVSRILFPEPDATDVALDSMQRVPDARPSVIVQVQSDNSDDESSTLSVASPRPVQELLSARSTSATALRKTRIALLGNFGTGKTTWCRKYARDLAVQYKADRTRRIPLVVSLSDYETRLDIQQLVTNTLQFRYGVRVDISLCQELQRLGRFVFIFDGLDEMATRVDPEVVRDNLREINKITRIDENLFIVTCRTHFFRDRVQAEVLGDFETLFIPEWGEAELTEYLQRCFGDDWDKHLERIRGTHNLEELAQTPLFLQMITETLPKLGEQVRRSELYAIYTETWIVEQSQRRGARLHRDDRTQFVTTLATKLYKDNRLSCHYSEFSEMLKARFGVQDAGQIDYLQSDIRSCTFLTRNSNGDYEFRHKSFMEYFVATAIRDQIVIGTNELLRLKLLPVEVSGFIVELLSDGSQNERLIEWHTSEQDDVLRDNVFSLMVGLRLSVTAEKTSALTSERSDEQAVLQFLKGDMEVFTQVMYRYWPTVYKVVRRYVKESTAATDISYDVFFTVLQRRDRITAPDQFVPHLISTAKWQAIDSAKRTKRNAGRHFSLDAYEGIADMLWDGRRSSPPELLIQREELESHESLVDALTSALRELSELERNVIDQSLFDGLGAAEVAKENNISVRALYKVRKRAIEKLRKVLTRPRET